MIQEIADMLTSQKQDYDSYVLYHTVIQMLMILLENMEKCILCVMF